MYIPDIYIYIYIYIYTHTHTHIYIYIYHTYIHITYILLYSGLYHVTSSISEELKTRLSSQYWKISALCRCFFADCLASVPDGQCSMADMRPRGPWVWLGHFQLGELHHWHLCHFCLVLDLVVQFKLYVTLCGWSAKQTISLSVVARNQTKGLDSRSPMRPEVGEKRQVREKPERSWWREM